jgi:hypothetical protein
MHLISFEESYCLSNENAKSTVKFALNDSLKVRHCLATPSDGIPDT